FGDYAAGVDGIDEATRKPNSRDDRPNILAVAIIALVEVIEVDLRHRTRIGRTQRHRSGTIERVRFQDRPGHVVVMLDDLARIAGEIARELGKQGHQEQVWLRLLRG